MVDSLESVTERRMVAELNITVFTDPTVAALAVMGTELSDQVPRWQMP